MRPGDSRAITAVACGLRSAMRAHADGRRSEIGEGWDDVAAIEHDDPRVSIALCLWECWADSAAHEWRYNDGLTEKDWPILADHVLAALDSGEAISDPRVLALLADESRSHDFVGRDPTRS